MKDVVLEINDTILATAYSEVSKGDTLVANARVSLKRLQMQVAMQLPLRFLIRQAMQAMVLKFL